MRVLALVAALSMTACGTTALEAANDTLIAARETAVSAEASLALTCQSAADRAVDSAPDAASARAAKDAVLAKCSRAWGLYAALATDVNALNALLAAADPDVGAVVAVMLKVGADVRAFSDAVGRIV